MLNTVSVVGRVALACILAGGSLAHPAAALAVRNGNEAVRILPFLIDMLDDPDVRMVALRAIPGMKEQAEPALPALRKLVKHEDAFVRSGVVYTLWQIGPAAKSDLEASTRDPDLHI